jgi:hypothetical protein
MIIVAMAQDHGIDGRQIDPKLLRITESIPGRTQIQQKPVPLCLDIEGQAVCTDTIPVPLRILDQIKNSH